MIKNKFICLWNWILDDPRRLVRIVVLFACTILVIYQLSECFWKLRHPPITTHSHFDINESMTYPAVTFCRDPAYKSDILAKYNLAYHPRFTSHWRNFPYGNVTMAEVFEEATYKKEEFFTQFSLNGNSSYIDVSSSIHFNYGRCHTLKPLVTTRAAWKDVGYSLILKHDLTDISQSTSQIPPGWHIFIHETTESFTENRMQTSGRVEYMYVEVGEEIEIKLTVQHFAMMANQDNSCTNDKDYSATKCGEICQWKKITDPIGCSGPWMPEIDLPECNMYNTTRALLVNYNYLENQDDRQCGCAEPCNSIIYSGFVMNRKKFVQSVPSAQVWLYYTSKLVTIIEERPGYDFPQFVADMGGSLGFLLGLSVLGLIGILEKIVLIIFAKFIPNRGANKNKEESSIETDEHSKSTLESPASLQEKINK